MKRGSIVLVPFPFSDLQGVKKRPALVLSNQKSSGDDLIVCAITSQKSLETFVIEPKNITKGILPKQSYVKYAKIFSIDKNVVIRTVAELNEASMEQIFDKISNVIS
jgi:mRNA interferase MazF